MGRGRRGKCLNVSGCLKGHVCARSDSGHLFLRASKCRRGLTQLLSQGEVRSAGGVGKAGAGHSGGSLRHHESPDVTMTGLPCQPGPIPEVGCHFSNSDHFR